MAGERSKSAYNSQLTPAVFLYLTIDLM